MPVFKDGTTMDDLKHSSEQLLNAEANAAFNDFLTNINTCKLKKLKEYESGDNNLDSIIELFRYNPVQAEQLRDALKDRRKTLIAEMEKEFLSYKSNIKTWLESSDASERDSEKVEEMFKTAESIQIISPEQAQELRQMISS